MSVSVVKQLPVEAFLLPEDDPAIVELLRGAEFQHHVASGRIADAASAVGACSIGPGAVNKKGGRDRSAAVCKWPAEHQDQFEAKGLIPWANSKPPPEVFQMWPGLYELNDREWDVLRMLGVESFPEHPCRTVNTSQSMGRTRALVDSTSCVSPKMRLYISGRYRFVHGLESLSLQGIRYPDDVQQQVRHHSSSFLLDLGGNAFKTSCCFAMVLSITLALATRDGWGWDSALLPREPASADAVDDADDELDIVWSRARSLEALGAF